MGTMGTKGLRSLLSLLAIAAFLLIGSVASAGTYTLAGKLIDIRGKGLRVPNVGNVSCAPLTYMVGPGVAGNATPPGPFPGNPVNFRAGVGDAQCVGAIPSATLSAANAGVVGGSFQLPFPAFSKPLPGYLQVVGITSVPQIVQFASSNLVTGPPATRKKTPGGTQATGCSGAGITLMCANHADFGRFRTGAWMTQTGRDAPVFTWCPPDPPAQHGTAGGACNLISQGGFGGIVKYNGATNAFGGTMSYVTTAGAEASLAQTIGAGAIAIAPLGGGAHTQPTGRGYADYHTDPIYAPMVFNSYMLDTVYQGPLLGYQRVITDLGVVGLPLGPGAAYNWGFPWTTRTVLVRNTGSVLGQARNTTFTAVGYDTVTAMGARNISLVAGAIQVGRVPGVGDVPLSSMGRMWLQLMPEPGGSSGLLAGALCLVGIAVWRARRTS